MKIIILVSKLPWPRLTKTSSQNFVYANDCLFTNLDNFHILIILSTKKTFSRATFFKEVLLINL